jgi:hypothetical protein
MFYLINQYSERPILYKLAKNKYHGQQIYTIDDIINLITPISLKNETLDL